MHSSAHVQEYIGDSNTVGTAMQPATVWRRPRFQVLLSRKALKHQSVIEAYTMIGCVKHGQHYAMQVLKEGASMYALMQLLLKSARAYSFRNLLRVSAVLPVATGQYVMSSNTIIHAEG